MLEDHSPKSEKPTEGVNHTLLGSAIGSVRDAVFGAPANDAERASRAEFNDNMAAIASDVIATLPHIRWFGAGALRATLMFDPNTRDPAATLVSTTANFIGGAAMNSIVKSSAFGRLQTRSAEMFGFGMKAESANLFATGASLGVVRELTSTRSWETQDGHFKLPDVSETLKQGVLQGALNVPAGLAGNRLTALVGRSDSMLSRVSTGITSGAASGGVFGGADAFLKTGELGQAAQGFMSGALVGGIAGGATAGLERGRQDAFFQIHKHLRDAPIAEGRGALIGATESPFVQNAMSTKGSGLEFRREAPTLKSLQASLPAPVEGTYRPELMNPFGPVNFWHKWQYTSNVISPLRPAQVYELPGTRLIVPKEYAEALAPVRELRLRAESGDEIAAGVLKNHPLGSRMLPEDALPLLESLPARNKLKEIQLLPHADAWNGWHDQFNDWARIHRQQTGKPFVALADATNSRGRVRWYKAESGTWSRSLQSVMDHEQVHLNQDPQYAFARRLDPKREASQYGYANKLESEAELESIAFLGASKSFFHAVEEAPIRMALLARKLESTPPAQAPEGTLAQRIAFVNEHALPAANQRLIELLNPDKQPATLGSAGRTDHHDALELLIRLNPKPQGDVEKALQGLATSPDHWTRRLASQALRDATIKSWESVI